MNIIQKADVFGDERVEIVSSPERMREIGPAWMALWRKAGGLAFQTHAWISAWWEHGHHGGGRTLRIGLAWKGDDLIAVVPLTISRRKGLRFLEWAALDYSDYCDMLLSPDCSPAVAARLWEALLRSNGYDIALVSRLAPDAAARPTVEGCMAGRVRLQKRTRTEISHRVARNGRNGSTWYEGLSKKTRKANRHGRNTIEKEGKLVFRLLPDDVDLGPVLQRLSVLKSRWLAERGLQSDLFEADRTTLQALVGVLADLGLLRIFVLECNGLIVSISINFVQNDTMMAWVTTFDPDFALSSPGFLLMVDYIAWSFDNGLHTVDFLCGAEAFKARFSTHSVSLETFWGARTLRGSLGLFVDAVRSRKRAESDPAEDNEPAAD